MAIPRLDPSTAIGAELERIAATLGLWRIEHRHFGLIREWHEDDAALRNRIYARMEDDPPVVLTHVCPSCDERVRPMQTAFEATWKCPVCQRIDLMMDWKAVELPPDPYTVKGDLDIMPHPDYSAALGICTTTGTIKITDTGSTTPYAPPQQTYKGHTTVETKTTRIHDGADNSRLADVPGFCGAGTLERRGVEVGCQGDEDGDV